MEHEEPKKLLAYDVNEAAKRLRVSVKTVRRLIDKGDLRRCKKIGRIKIPASDVENFYENNSEYVFSC